MSSKKCPQCGLVNFVSAEVCKCCGADLKEQVKLPADEAPLEISPEEQAHMAQLTLTPSLVPEAQVDPQAWRLVPCPDCDRQVSLQASPVLPAVASFIVSANSQRW